MTAFGDTAKKEEMVLTWGLSMGPHSIWLVFLEEGQLGHMNRYQRRTWTEQRPWGAQLEGGHLQAKETTSYQHRICLSSFQNCRKTKLCCPSTPRLCYWLRQLPANQCPFFPLQRHFTHGCLALKYDSISLALPGERHWDRPASDLLGRLLFQKVLLQFQHGLNCLLALQHRMSESAR